MTRKSWNIFPLEMSVKRTTIQSIFEFWCDFFFFFLWCWQVHMYSVPACLLLSFSVIESLFLFSCLVTLLLSWTSNFGSKVETPWSLESIIWNNWELTLLTLKVGKTELIYLLLHEEPLTAYLVRLRLYDYIVQYLKYQIIMVHPVDWKIKENGYLFSTLYLPWDCCVSAYLIKDTVTPVLFTFVTDRKHCYIIWHFFELIGRKSYSWNLRVSVFMLKYIWMKHLIFFPWNLPKWVSRKVILKSQNFFIIFHFT